MGVLALSGGGVVTAKSGEGAGSYSGPRSHPELTALESLGLRVLGQDRGPWASRSSFRGLVTRLRCWLTGMVLSGLR